MCPCSLQWWEGVWSGTSVEKTRRVMPAVLHICGMCDVNIHSRAQTNEKPRQQHVHIKLLTEVTFRAECSIKMCEQTIRRSSLRIKCIIMNMRSCKPNGYAIASITYNPRSLIKQPAERALRKKARRLSMTQKRKILKICKQISTWIHCFEAETRVAPPLFFVGPKPTLPFFFFFLKSWVTLCIIWSWGQTWQKQYNKKGIALNLDVSSVSTYNHRRSLK